MKVFRRLADDEQEEAAVKKAAVEKEKMRASDVGRSSDRKENDSALTGIDDHQGTSLTDAQKLLPEYAPRSDDLEAVPSGTNLEAQWKPPARVRTIIATAGCASVCCALLVGALIGAILCGWRDTDGPTAPFAPPTPPSSVITSGCAAYNAGHSFDGLQYTMTADGLVEAEGEAEEEGEALAEHGINNVFAPTFFDFQCLLGNGTGDPCDAHVAEAYADQMFEPLRIDSQVSLWVSLIVLFSLAQLGGVPRPRPVSRAGVEREGNTFHDWLLSLGIKEAYTEFVFWDWTGMLFWFAWMATQACQFLVVAISLAMEVVAFFGTRARLAPCLVTVGNATLLDDYAMLTFAVQPALLARLLLLVAYGYLLSLGLLVFSGRTMTEKEFVSEATKTRGGRLTQPIPLASTNYLLSRWVLYGACFGTIMLSLGSATGLLLAAWAMGLAVAATGSFTGGFSQDVHWIAALKSKSFAQMGFFFLPALLAFPVLRGLAYLPLAGLFLAFVKLSFAAARVALELIDKHKDVQNQGGGCISRLTNLMRMAAGPTKTAIGWLGPLRSLKLTNGMAMVNQGLGYTETSLSTLAAGLACVLGCLALSPLMAYGGWASMQRRLEGPDFDVVDSTVDAIKSHVWVLWVLVAVPVVLYMVDGIKMKGKLIFKRCERKGLYFNFVKGVADNVLLTIYVIPFLVLLIPAVFFTSLSSSYAESIIGHMQTCYSDSFAVLGMLQLDLSGIEPLFDSAMALVTMFLGDPLSTAQDVVDRLSEMLEDPLAPVQEIVEAAANMTRYLEIDPSYFAKNVAALDVLNIALGTLKLAATYGRKVFALIDGVRALLSGQEDQDDEDDGTVQVHECMADPVRAQRDAGMAILCAKAGTTLEAVQDAEVIDLSGKGLDAGDAATLAAWLVGNATLKELKCVSLLKAHPRTPAPITRFVVNSQQHALFLALFLHVLRFAHSLADNQICGVNRLNGGTYTAEGITALCEVLKDTQITSLKCAALPPLLIRCL